MEIVMNVISSTDYPSLIVSSSSQLQQPTLIQADQLPDNSRDCFGREKHAEYRDDMGGVGSFNRQNRTLYIGKMQESPDKKQTEETLMRHFGEWGKIVKCESYSTNITGSGLNRLQGIYYIIEV